MSLFFREWSGNTVTHGPCGFPPHGQEAIFTVHSVHGTCPGIFGNAAGGESLSEDLSWVSDVGSERKEQAFWFVAFCACVGTKDSHV